MCLLRGPGSEASHKLKATDNRNCLSNSLREVPCPRLVDCFSVSTRPHAHPLPPSLSFSYNQTYKSYTHVKFDSTLLPNSPKGRLNEVLMKYSRIKIYMKGISLIWWGFLVKEEMESDKFYFYFLFFLLCRLPKGEAFVWISLGKGEWILWLLNLEKFKCKRKSVSAALSLLSPSLKKQKTKIPGFLILPLEDLIQASKPSMATSVLHMLLFLPPSPSSFLFLLLTSTPKSPSQSYLRCNLTVDRDHGLTKAFVKVY